MSEMLQTVDAGQTEPLFGVPEGSKLMPIRVDGPLHTICLCKECKREKRELTEAVRSGALSMCEECSLSLTEWLESEYGRAIWPEPLKAGMTLTYLVENYHVDYYQAVRDIKSGLLRASVMCKKRGRRRKRKTNHHILVCVRKVAALYRHRGTQLNVATAVAGDLLSVPKMKERIFDLLDRSIGINTIKDWCKWKEHPALWIRSPTTNKWEGRAVRSQEGIFEVTTTNNQKRSYSGLLVSDADIQKCARMLIRGDNPVGERFGHNPGVWEIVIRKDSTRNFARKKHAPIYGLFRRDRQAGDECDDDCTYGTWPYLVENLGVKPGIFSNKFYESKLDPLKVILPGCQNRWLLTVYSVRSVKAVILWQKEQDADGAWVHDSEEWRDSLGVWYTAKFIVREMKLLSKGSLDFEEYQVSNWLQQGRLTKTKIVRRATKGNGRGSPSRVFHEIQIKPLFDLAKSGKAKKNEEFIVPFPFRKYPGHMKIPQLTGKPRSEEREAVCEYCYDEYVTKMIKPMDIVASARKRFGLNSKYIPGSGKEVKERAWAWAERFEPNLPWRDQ